MAENPSVFDLLRPPVWHGGVIVSSPHSGRDYPQWALAESRLSLAELRSSEDAFVDHFVRPAQVAGAVALIARVPRSIVDLNRGPDELDPLVIRNLRKKALNPRVIAGLGVIPRVVSGGRVIRNEPLTEGQAQARVDAFWRPYHAALRALIDEAMARFGGALVIDMHSMPRDALSSCAPPRPEIVIGDRHGRSAAPDVVRSVSRCFAQEGFRLLRNTPFAGAYIAQAYGRPLRNIHVMQVEIDRSLYMNERLIQPLLGFDGFTARMARIMQRLARLSPSGSALPIVAE